LSDLPYLAEDSGGSFPVGGGSLARSEQEEIVKALQIFKGNRTKAAEHLGINRKTLREKLRKYQISDSAE
jgi:DNA-binding NtrC family response regulator